MAYEFLTGLSQNFSKLLDDTDDYDVIIKVGENQDIKEFRAHSIILKSRSPYFKRALSQYWITKKDNMINFTKPNISPKIFDMIIRYMYAGVLDLNVQDGSDILDLIIASDELLLDELLTFVQDYLIKNQTEWIQKNFFKIIQTVFQLENCKQLQNYYFETICIEPEPFFNSPELLLLEESIVLELVQREDLQIDEIELWNCLIKWGMAQTFDLREKDVTNLSSWSEKDFIDLKSALNKFIAHIRFFEISSEDFHSKILPFRKLLPQSLFEDIESFYNANTIPKQNDLSPRHGKVAIDSSIIKPKHAAIISNWIQRKDSIARIPKDHKYNFDLIYRKSRDGHDINTIRNKCNGQSACVLVIKTKEDGTIIGGYNPLGWNDCIQHTHDTIFKYSNYYYWANTSETFIFSFGDGNDWKNFTISRVVDESNAIYESNYRNIPLNFGNSDLVIKDDTGYCNQTYYESQILDSNDFIIEEMEIFRFYQTE